MSTFSVGPRHQVAIGLMATSAGHGQSAVVKLLTVREQRTGPQAEAAREARREKPRFLRPPKPKGQWPRMGQSTANVKIVGAKRRKLLHACPRAICAGPQRERRAPWPRPRAPKFCPSASMVEAIARKSGSETFGGIETRSGVHHSTTPIEPEHGCRSSAQDFPP